MFIATEGTIEIPLEQLQEWIARENPQLRATILHLGVPKTNKDNRTLEIDFVAASGDDPTNPMDWAEKPNALKQWDN
jgi:hypothetical protein